MTTFWIAVVPGDGIGPEVISAAIEILEAACGLTGGFALKFQDAPAGAGTYLEQGEALPASTFETCRQSDAILLGACGLPDVRYPDGTEIIPQVTLRIKLDLFAGIRPAATIPGITPTLHGGPPIDLVIVRESTEGIFASLGGGVVLRDEVATDIQVITRRGTERVVRSAFHLARRRARPEPRVTCVDKANILRSFAFFRKVFDEVAQEFPDVVADHLYVDAAAFELVRRPSRFDVLVTENLLGDILSDLTAGLVGGMGVAPSGDIGPDHAVFQPCHGTAPDLIGKGIANPIASILSAAMMLEYLADCVGEEAPRMAAQRIVKAVHQAIKSGEAITHDLGGSASTRQATQAVLSQLNRVES